MIRFSDTVEVSKLEEIMNIVKTFTTRPYDSDFFDRDGHRTGPAFAGSVEARRIEVEPLDLGNALVKETP
jgi:hypothetical protein